ncbi:hypothetical protein [Paraliobacillus sp. JSM ZJ581]|uniref:hypothetical protein n=1 Tax=Paraliobacillus sp. JSM ZJ581 TaxID=3342118 RepID=UPI0035A9AC96
MKFAQNKRDSKRRDIENTRHVIAKKKIAIIYNFIGTFDCNKTINQAKKIKTIKLVSLHMTPTFIKMFS